jgi:hypothetical protein
MQLRNSTSCSRHFSQHQQLCVLSHGSADTTRKKGLENRFLVPILDRLLPAARWSVILASHNWFGPLAVKSVVTMLSHNFRPGPFPFFLIVFQVTDLIPTRAHQSHMVRSAIWKPASQTESPWVCWRFHTLETRMESWTNTTGQVEGIRLRRKLPRFGW